MLACWYRSGALYHILRTRRIAYLLSTMETINQFQYNYANLLSYQFDADWVIFIGITIGGILVMLASYLCIRALALYSINYHIEQTLAKKKKTLGDLILMKDIQTELEKEIEQAILKAAFHS